MDAVNTLLSVVGELPVTTLEGPLNSDALLAYKTLQEVLVEFQSKEWHFNTEENFTLTPDQDGTITVSESVRNIDLSPLSSGGVDVVLRGRRLYDRKNSTYVFNTPLKATITHMFPFDDIPQTAKNYVVSWASMKFQAKILGASDAYNMWREDFLRAERAFVAEDIRNSDRNILDMSSNSVTGFNTVSSILRRK